MDLDEWINEPPPSESSDSEPEISKPNLFLPTNSESLYSESYQGKQVELTQEELDKVCFAVN